MHKRLYFFLAIFIWIQSVVPGLGVIELGKLPALFSHYQKHRSNNTELSFASFLAMHYSNESHHSQDPKEHHRLPFSNHHTSVSLAHVYFMVVRDYSFTASLVGIDQTHQSFYQVMAEQSTTTMVWQPPRMI